MIMSPQWLWVQSWSIDWHIQPAGVLCTPCCVLLVTLLLPDVQVVLLICRMTSSVIRTCTTDGLHRINPVSFLTRYHMKQINHVQFFSCIRFSCLFLCFLYNVFGETLKLTQLQNLCFLLQGCGRGLGLGLQTVSRLNNVSSRSRSRLEKNCQRYSWSRLGLGHLLLMPKTNFRPNCASAITVSWWACRWHHTQCERALDIVSLCCNYHCSSY